MPTNPLPPAVTANLSSNLQVFTDGACQGNPGPGGWAWAVDPASVPASASAAPSCSGNETRSTNQRMEVWAVLDALETLLPVTSGQITVVSDSTYVVNCFRDSWYRGWMARGWRNSQKQPVANQDLWQPLVQRYLSDKERIAFRWVKGHSGNAMNDLVDQLAVAAAAAQNGRDLRDPGQWWTEAPGGGGAVAPSGGSQGSLF